jgi:hypothetical protein
MADLGLGRPDSAADPDRTLNAVAARRAEKVDRSELSAASGMGNPRMKLSLFGILALM